MRVPILVGVGASIMAIGMAAGADMQEQSYLDVAAEVSTPAQARRRMQVTPTQPPPVPTGLNGMPLAPSDLTGCQEMSFYRQQAGLISHFDGLGFRESGCRNSVTSAIGCCHGYWQIHRLWIGQLRHCDIDSVDDFLGNEGLDKQRNACAAKYIYSVQGGGAWDAW